MLLHARASQRQRGGHRCKPVALLDPQFVQSGGAGGAVCQCCGDEQHRKFIDHARRESGIDINPGQRRMAHAQIGNRLAADFAAVLFLDIRAHLAQHCQQSGAGRVHADIQDRQIAARNDARRDHKERRGGGIAGNGHVHRPQLSLAVNADNALAAVLAHFEPRAEACQHPLGVVARWHRFDHASDAGGVEARQQHRAFDLRARHREAVGDRHGRCRAAQHQREGAARRSLNRSAHLRQRGDNTVHRAARKAGIADKGRGDRVAGNQSHQQPGRRARIAHVKRALGFEQTTHARTVNCPHAARRAFNVRAELPHRRRRGEHVLAFEQACDPAFSHGQPGKHQRAVADRLVAGNADSARKRG